MLRGKCMTLADSESSPQLHSMIAVLFAAALDQIADGRAGCLVTVLARAGNKPSRSLKFQNH